MIYHLDSHFLKNCWILGCKLSLGLWILLDTWMIGCKLFLDENTSNDATLKKIVFLDDWIHPNFIH